MSEHKPVGNDTTEIISLQDIEHWKSELGRTALSDNARRLHQMLSTITQTELSFAQRFELINALQPSVDRISDPLRNLSGFEGISNEDNYVIADLIMSLDQLMLHNYKLLLEAKTSFFWLHQKRFFILLKQAMLYCVKILFYAYDQYRSPPPGIWLDLHTLFGLSQQKYLSNKKIEKTLDWPFSYSTLTHLYKHCLIFYIANPYHFARTELQKIKYVMEAWAPLLELKKAEPGISPIFSVDTYSDNPPKYAKIKERYEPNECFLMLEQITNRLLQLLSVKKNIKKNKKTYAFSSAELDLPTLFVEFLLNRWTTMLSKVSKREKIQGIVQACLGISASFELISKEHCVFIPSVNAPLQTETLDVDALLRQHASLQPNLEEKPRCQTFSCELVNQSASGEGYCLKWAEKIPPQLQSGEIITLEKMPEESNNIWITGTVRWLKQKEDQSALIGVQILSTNTFAAKARLVDTPGSLAIPTLLLPEQPNAMMETKTLVTPPLPFKAGQKIELIYNNETYIATLQKNYSISPSYQQFGLEFEHEPQLPNAPLSA